jgi:hypothetical protein
MTTPNYYLEHLPQILGSAAAYQLLDWVSPALSTRLLRDKYTQLSTKDRRNFDIHVVALLQCLVSIVAIIPLAGDEYLAQDAIRNYTPYAGFVSSITIGYFLWDAQVCLRHFDLFGPGFLLHAVASLYVFLQTLRPFCLGWVASFLSFELSSPFVNINWFITKLPAGTVPAWFQLLNGLLLMVVFFFVRIIWGFYAIFSVSKDFWYVEDYPKWVMVSVVFLNVSLDSLNVLWFKKMLRIAAKKIAAKDKKKD